MKIELHRPLSIFARGRRENMEDYIFPEQGIATSADFFFIVCDGMGGHTKGETASKLACEGFSGYFAAHPVSSPSEPYFLDAFDHVQGLFDAYIDEHQETRGMGTTLVMVYLAPDAAHVIHCGDSRFYHFRDRERLWRTRDHKLVEEWVSQGLISAQEALKHPMSNRITRAIQGYGVLKVKPDIHVIHDLKPGDYFFLCTDGIYESITDEELEDIISASVNDDEKLKIINEVCEGNSKDNYSAFLLNIRSII
ncbi:MAG: serine/threonine-protein phosphatase [Bacteroidales bacterium]|nr:serine/threonine-protein phosphatase [Bacteroidales bacterium]